MSQFYVSVGGQTYGPVSSDELEKWYKAETFRPTDFVWDDLSGAWVEAIRFDATRHIFRDVQVPSTGILSVDELMDPERGRYAETSENDLGYCTNHDEDKAVAVCPRCAKAFCESCLKNIDGAMICMDCLGKEKRKGASKIRLYMPVVGAALAASLLITICFLYAGGPPEQPEKLEQIEIPYRSAAPAAQQDIQQDAPDIQFQDEEEQAPETEE